jgi:hypothetical protein
MPPKRRRRKSKPEDQPVLSVDQKASTLLGWCQAGQHEACWKETTHFICNCKVCTKTGRH